MLFVWTVLWIFYFILKILVSSTVDTMAAKRCEVSFLVENYGADREICRSEVTRQIKVEAMIFSLFLIILMAKQVHIIYKLRNHVLRAYSAVLKDEIDQFLDTNPDEKDELMQQSLQQVPSNPAVVYDDLTRVLR
jgi:hypothetical protein